MDFDLEKDINKTVEYLKGVSNDKLDFKLMDPIAKMMLVALLHESQKIKDYIGGLGEKIAEKFCEDFIPRREVGAMPALAVVGTKFKPKKDTEPVIIEGNVPFTYRSGDNKQLINYIPIFNTLCIPFQKLYILTKDQFICGNNIYNSSMDVGNSLWIGIETKAEIETLKGLSILISGTNGIIPEHLYVGTDNYELEISDMSNFENMELAEPFDAQQTSREFISIIENWKDVMLNLDNKSIIYITDPVKNRDLFKPKTYPESFGNWVESSILNELNGNIIWFNLTFSSDFVIPDSFSMNINVLPVVNVDINNVTLTQTSPIAKLQKQDDSFFLQIIETSNASKKQGFNLINDDVIVRDFDATCYHNGNLYRDIRCIYNHFIDDYYAFIEYNGIKDGETIKQLRDLMNKLGKSVGTYNSKFNFDSGTYAMKNMNQFPQTSSVKVSFTTTLGEKGNSPKVGDTFENKKLPTIEKELPVIVSAMGGTDKATLDEKYENLRYYTLTNDRLFTKKDIEAFLRKEIISEFGKGEFKRILIEINIEGAAGDSKLQRGLYITIKFKDGKNYEKAINTSLKNRLYQKIINRSCISMPIIVNLSNLDC